MTDFLNNLQQAWQAQCGGKLAMQPDQMLKLARLERRIYFWCDVLMLAFFVAIGAWMLRSALHDFQRNWPWLIYVASDVWVVGFILFSQWRKRRHAADFDEPLLAHVEWSIKEIEHRMWQERYAFWWYVLPIAVGCMLPPLFFFALDHTSRPLADSLLLMLFNEAIFVVTFVFVHLVMEYGRRKGLPGKRQELETLRNLRETLLHASEDN